MKLRLFDLLMQHTRLDKQIRRVNAQVDDLTQQESAVCGVGADLRCSSCYNRVLCFLNPYLPIQPYMAARLPR